MAQMISSVAANAIIFLLNNEGRGDGNSDHEVVKNTFKKRVTYFSLYKRKNCMTN